MDDRYYTEEINYLLEQGKEFAKQHPQQARMLHLDDVRSREPNVERLIESFAFLTSRVRKRLDDDFPQIADGLLSLMWPGYINPIPSFCILEFLPSSLESPEVITIPKGVTIDSEPIDGTQCRFRTCFETNVLPISISNVSVDSAGATSTLTLSFTLAKGVNIGQLSQNELNIQLIGEFFPSWQVYDLILGKHGSKSHVAKVELLGYDAEKKAIGTWNFSSKSVLPVGLTTEEMLLPTGKTALWSYSLLKDFFVFPEKYQAFRLRVLAPLSDQSSVESFDIQIHYDCPWPSNLRLTKDQFRINTVPVVNLFSRDATPINLNRRHYHYTVRGDVENPEHFQVYSVDSVESITVGSNKRSIYSPVYSAHSRTTTTYEEDKQYILDRRNSSWGGWETYISFVDSKAQIDYSEEEIVSIGVTCTNGRLPSKLLPNQIRFPVSHIDESLKVRNITHPTAFVLPNLEQVSLWRWLSHAALNYMSIGSSKQLKSLLKLHDFSDAEANRHKIEGIKSIELAPTRILFKGALIPGISVKLSVKEDHFNHLGEIQLFARLLSVFMSSYASINSYIQLTVQAEPSNHQIVIAPSIGDVFQL